MAISKTIKNLPIRKKITLAFVGNIFVVLVINAVAYLFMGWYSTWERLEGQLSATAMVFAENVSAAISFNDEGAARSVLRSVKAMSQIQLVCVYAGPDEASERLFADYKALSVQSECLDHYRQHMTNTWDASIRSVQPITLGNDTLGHIYLQRGTADLRASAKFTALTVFAMLVGSMLVAYSLTRIFRKQIEHPIQRLLETTQRVSSDRNFDVRAEKVANDEIGQLFDGFNTMLDQLQIRDHQLVEARRELEIKVQETESANTALNDSINKLRATQEQLVQQEKMASLGGLVAGVAHEINTPIGVGVTAASTLHDETKVIAGLYESKQLGSSRLQKYLKTAELSSDILLVNLGRAAELIHSFKQVAVDQTSSELRTFDLDIYLNEVLLSLMPNIKKSGLEVVTDIEPLVEMCSFPGAISQIFANLVMNSISHAFPDQSGGTISIAVQKIDNNVLLTYRDNGIGMDKNTLRRVFDPFFTTRRGAGGSGLGMHIVYNLATQKLRGSISMESEPGCGVEVTLNIPRVMTIEDDHDGRR